MSAKCATYFIAHFCPTSIFKTNGCAGVWTHIEPDNLNALHQGGWECLFQVHESDSTATGDCSHHREAANGERVGASQAAAAQGRLGRFFMTAPAETGEQR
ncbi:hypothetical protein DPEC_G00052230 [Dallia pectoralis]|uniref:Uncharacterized protein n=1 Tax=Dallia pectoralis TaxID=75939 RepID=A0ACC2HBU9_DALPE|nr:hypothetical protein DPEC_G00052230 [Dallia pectoralis]